MESVDDQLRARAEVHFKSDLDGVYRRTDRVFLWLMLFQWAFAIVLALVFSPYGWAGKVKVVHAHVWAAVLLGGALSSLPVALILLRPGAAVTRHTVAISQMLWSALLIHLTGGRIETHFHVFGSLAFLAFYRDWKVLIPATVTVAGDHLIRGILWPESVYGITNPEWWRFLEHASWVAFEDVVLVLSCLRGVAEMRATARRQAELELVSLREKEKSGALDAALTQLQQSQEILVRTEKLAAVGQLAASVGHELRNPLAAIRNAHAYVNKRLAAVGGEMNADPRVGQFMAIIERELNASSKIISDLLDFARERPLARQPCPLRPLVEEASALVPQKANVQIHNDVSEELPIPSLDKEQFRQVVVNLVQNAVEAIPPSRAGEVKVSAAVDEGGTLSVRVRDNGQGIPAEVKEKIFQPLFTTKTKGTGLGLAIVSGMVTKHGGSIRVESQPERGTEFIIELPTAVAALREAR